MKEGFVTPPKHVGFEAKKLFNESAQISDVAIAYMAPNGGGPTELHTHTHDHLFLVTKGEAKIILENRSVIVKENESYRVKGSIPHSVWNNINSETVMIGITIQN